jgi:hypothetical protein
MNPLASRLAKLEQAAVPGHRAFVWCDRGKTVDEAIAEHVAAHPGDKGAEFTVFSWLLSGETKA